MYQDSLNGHDTGSDDEANFHTNVDQARDFLQQSTLNAGVHSKLIPDSVHAFLGLEAKDNSTESTTFGAFYNI